MRAGGARASLCVPNLDARGGRRLLQLGHAVRLTRLGLERPVARGEALPVLAGELPTGTAEA
jgi:hypothetical protein